MLLLTSTNDNVWVEALVGGGVLHLHASFLDVIGVPPVVTPGRRNYELVGIGAYSIAGTPAASTQRNVKRINVLNYSGPTNTVIVRHTDGTFDVRLATATLLLGESLDLDAVGEWHHYDPNGAEYVRP
jgi:hypothetical protein